MSPDEGEPAGIARARQEIEAALVLVERGFPLQAVSRAYSSALYATEEALLALGETRSGHPGVIAAFIRLVVRGSGFDDATARLLPSLFNARNRADHGSNSLTQEDAEDAIRDADRFVDAVRDWLKTRGPGPPGESTST